MHQKGACYAMNIAVNLAITLHIQTLEYLHRPMWDVSHYYSSMYCAIAACCTMQNNIAVDIRGDGIAYIYKHVYCSLMDICGLYGQHAYAKILSQHTLVQFISCSTEPQEMIPGKSSRRHR